MLKRSLILALICLLLPWAAFAEETADQEYVNRLTYQREKLELVTKRREVDERSSYSYTDIDSYTYTYEAFAHTSTDISTQRYDRAEKKEITEWYIYKGGIRELSDSEFLALVGDTARLDRILEMEAQKGKMRGLGNIFIGTGLLVMIGGGASSAGSAVITGGALTMTTGFFISAFNLSPAHYIQPDYAQEKIDEHNIALKKKLGLPLNYN
ncbi:hypothetical protein ACFL1W_00435 [Candidatus Margulisiibacteriota bacterium]